MKVFNRPIKLGGHDRTVNDVALRVLEYDVNGDILRCTGVTVPTADSVGFAKGCLFIKTDAADGTKGLYENEGTRLLSDFNLVGNVSGDELDLGSSGTPLAHTAATEKAYSVYTTTSSTHSSTSYEPVLFHTTLTGAGQVGGRVRAYMTTNVALGSWSNALKAEVVYGASGRTAGLGSAMVAEMTLSAGTSAGTYALYEGELNLGTGALTGTLTSLYHASVNGADAGTFDDNGYVLNLQGLTAGAAHVFRTGLTASTVNNACTAALKIRVGSTDYFIPLATATA